MHMKLNKLFVLILGIFGMFLVNSKGVLAQVDCCAGHGGVIFCNPRADRLQCYDGTLSKICTCEGIIRNTIKVKPTMVSTTIPTVIPTPTIDVQPTVLPTPILESKPSGFEAIIQDILKFLGIEK